MNKTLFVVFALLIFVAVFAWAKSDNGLISNLGKGASKWASIRINNDDLPSTLPTRAKVQQVFFAGTGIAVNPDDKLDFKYVRIIGGRVLVPENNVSDDSANSSDLDVKCVNTTSEKERCFVFVRAGLLYLDKERYTLRKIDFDNDSATASIYRNSTEVGSLALVKIVKMGRRMWVGTLTLDNTNYYAYILGADHPLLIGNTTEDKTQGIWDKGKKCGPKLPSVNSTEISNCKKNGGRIYIGRGDNGCPLAPTCVTTNCTKVTPLSAQDTKECRDEGGTVIAGVDDEGCPATPKCVLASGETR